MQLVFICGGVGARLHGRPAGVPKSMLVVGGQPLLGRLWRGLGHWHDATSPPVIVAAAGDPHVPAFAAAAMPGARVVTQAAPDGVASAIGLALPHLTGPALVVLGDLWLDGQLAAPPPQAPALVVWPEAPPAVTTRNFGIRVADGRPAALHEKPADPAGLVCGLGLYLLTPEVIAGFAAAAANPISGEREITAALAAALPAGFALWRFAGRYINVNTAADLAEAEAAR